MGVRMIDEFLAKSGWARCATFREALQVLSAVAFRMFLNCAPRLVVLDEAAQDYALLFDAEAPLMPLLEVVVVPAALQPELRFANLVPGVVTGALEMLQMQCQCEWTAEAGRGLERSELRVRLVRVLTEEMPPGE